MGERISHDIFGFPKKREKLSLSDRLYLFLSGMAVNSAASQPSHYGGPHITSHHNFDPRFNFRPETPTERAERLQRMAREARYRSDREMRSGQARAHQEYHQFFNYLHENAPSVPSAHEARIREVAELFPDLEEVKVRGLFDTVVDSRKEGMSDAEIYRDLALRHHPDLNPEPERHNSELTMSAISGLYDPKAKSFNL